MIKEVTLSLQLCSTARCFKWRFEDSCEAAEPSKLYLKNRKHGQNLVTQTPQSVSFTSPNYRVNGSSNYLNKMLCVYRISVDDCESGIITVRSTSDDDRLYDDGQDYLFLDLGHVTTAVKGSGVSMFSETIHATSLTTVFWTDSKKTTSAGKFKMEAVCHNTPETMQS